MNKLNRQTQTFFFSQEFADGVRITLGILVPSLLMAWFGQLETGFIISIGALCVSITDSPGPVAHKRNAMLLCSVCLLLVGIISGFAAFNPFLAGAVILGLGFFFSMFAVYGHRASALGSAAILLMILMLDQPLDLYGVFRQSALAMGGGIWYLTLSLVFSQIRPYRPAQRALGDCIREVAKFMRIKALFYDTGTDLDDNYKKLVLQQIVVSEKQDAVRELLFKSRLIVKESTSTSRSLLLTFSNVVDFYEQVSSMFYDYQSIRDSFGKSGILKEISKGIEQLADDLDTIGFSIQTDIMHSRRKDHTEELKLLWQKIDASAQNPSDRSNLVLKKILVNLRDLGRKTEGLWMYFRPDYHAGQNRSVLEYSKFVSRQEYDIKIFKDNLTRSSSVFRYSVRVALALLTAYSVAGILPYSQYSYWVMLTVFVVLKPAFSLSKQRNIQRLTGTVAGCAIGILILLVIANDTALFAILVVFMVASFSFQRINYIVSVILMTPFVLIMFHFMGLGPAEIIRERVIDTAVGCAIGFMASWLLFPNWEVHQLRNYMRDTLAANVHYLQKLADLLSGEKVEITEYKLARKNVYVSSANLAAAFQRMLSEPKNKQRNSKEVHRFVVLNHILSSNISTVASAMLESKRSYYPNESQQQAKSSLTVLQSSLIRFGIKNGVAAEAKKPAANSKIAAPAQPGDKQLTEQLAFINKLTRDIEKVTGIITGKTTEPPEEKAPAV